MTEELQARIIKALPPMSTEERNDVWHSLLAWSQTIEGFTDIPDVIVGALGAGFMAGWLIKARN